jgi:hypothetical protein
LSDDEKEVVVMAEWKDEKLKAEWEEYWDQRERDMKTMLFPYKEITERAIEIVHSSDQGARRDG